MAFDPFRSDLKPLIDAWEPRLKVIWEDTVAREADKDTRLAAIVEHNRFNELLGVMKWLWEDNGALERYAKKIGHVRSKVLSAVQTAHESVGDDIDSLVKRCEGLVSASAMVSRSISCIKEGHEVIPLAKREELITRLNRCITAINQWKDHGGQGIILQLRESKSFVRCMAVVYTLQCQDCGHMFACSGNSDCDVFAPARCSKCGSCHLSKSNKIQRHCGHFVDSRAQVSPRVECPDCKMGKAVEPTHEVGAHGHKTCRCAVQ